MATQPEQVERLEIVLPRQSQQTRQDQLDLLNRADAIKVTDHASFLAASEALRDLRGAIKWFKEWFRPTKKQADDLHSSICDMERDAITPLQNRDARLSKEMGAWEMAERHRQEAERRRQMEELRRQEDDRRLQQAIELERAGHKDEAEQILDAPATFIAPPPPPRPAMAQGMSARKRWTFTITDASLIPRAYLVPNESAIRAAVNGMGMEAQRLIPGIAVAELDSYAVRK